MAFVFMSRHIVNLGLWNSPGSNGNFQEHFWVRKVRLRPNQITMTKLPNPRDLVIAKEVKVTNGIKGHQHREKKVLHKQNFNIHEKDID